MNCWSVPGTAKTLSGRFATPENVTLPLNSPEGVNAVHVPVPGAMHAEPTRPVVGVPQGLPLPLQVPGAYSVYRLAFGLRTVNRSVEKRSASLSETIITWMLGVAAASFGSSTVI